MLPFKKSGIYKITNLIRGLVYIGSAADIGNRWSSHKKDLKKNIHANSYLQRAWNKYGEEAFEFVILELVEDKNKLIEREQYWMDYYKSYERDKGYNINPKAESCRGVKRLKPNPRKGLKNGPQSKETCEKKRLAHLGVKRAPFTPEHIQKRTLAFLLRKHFPEDLVEEIRSCACGCAETFVVMKYKKQRYIAYHAARGRKTWNTGLTNEDPRVKSLTEKRVKAVTGKPHKKRKQFCKQGHDTFICGRTKGYQCIECLRILVLKRRKEKISVGNL